MSSASQKSTAAKPQIVCIDLPGESVQCWRSTDKVQVVLKKHRDIIFDLKLGGRGTYTVESTGSDFYNADKKKLIAGAGKQRVMFDDGERLHLWIARDFTGELLLKSAGKLMMRLDPAKLDSQRYDNDPKTKPIPIVIALGVPSPNSSLRTAETTKARNLDVSFRPVQPAAAPVEEGCTIVCVVDGNIEGIPADIWAKIKSGGGNSGLVDLDPNDVTTRNWLLGQIAGAGAYVGDNWDWLKESIDGKTHNGFRLVKAKIHYVKGKARYYFSGYSKANNAFGPGGFGAGHERVLSIFSGAGNMSSALKSVAKGVGGSIKGNALVAFIFGSVSSLAEWKEDISKDGYDLSAALLMNLVKSLIVAALTAGIVALLVTIAMFALGVSLSVLAVGAATVAVGVGISYGVDVLDKKLGRMAGGIENNDGLSSILAKYLRENIQGNWDFLKDKKFWDYKEEWFARSRLD